MLFAKIDFATGLLKCVMLNIDLFSLLLRFSKSWALKYERRRRQAMARWLENVDSEILENYGKKLALHAFKQAARHSVFYEKLLASKKISINSIRAINDFAKLPILEKEIFKNNEIIDLAVGRNLEDVNSILTSSGYSGLFSFGVNTKTNLTNTARFIDFVLDYIFNISGKKILIINCLPMGVKIYTNSAVLAEVSVREDMAIALIQKFQKYFQEMIIVGEAFFLKNLVEEGIEAGINWKSLPISLIVGEDSFPESYRDYIGNLLGIDHDASPLKRLVGSSLGIAECSLNLFHETPATIALRRFACQNKEFKKEVFGEEEICPMLFTYYPTHTYLEETSGGEIIITMLSPAKIPIIRYNSKDCGKIISYRQLKEILKKFNREDLLPRLKLPLIAIKTRANSEIGDISGDKIRDFIFSNPQIARELTGFFKIKSNKTSTQVKLQLKKNGFWQKEYEDIIKSNFTAIKIIIKAVPYYDFPEALTLDYNKKFKYT
jgi:phenylacetate-CoA ligase